MSCLKVNIGLGYVKPLRATVSIVCDVWVGGDVLLANAKILLDNDKIIVV